MAETAQLIAVCKHWLAPTAPAHCTVILPAGADEETKAKMSVTSLRSPSGATAAPACRHPESWACGPRGGDSVVSRMGLPEPRRRARRWSWLVMRCLISGCPSRPGTE